MLYTTDYSILETGNDVIGCFLQLLVFSNGKLGNCKLGGWELKGKGSLLGNSKQVHNYTCIHAYMYTTTCTRIPITRP